MWQALSSLLVVVTCLASVGRRADLLPICLPMLGMQACVLDRMVGHTCASHIGGLVARLAVLSLRHSSIALCATLSRTATLLLAYLMSFP